MDAAAAAVLAFQVVVGVLDFNLTKFLKRSTCSDVSWTFSIHD